MTYRETLASLLHQEGYPSVSVLARTHRTAPDNHQDPITLKNLIAEVEERLAKEFSGREYTPLVEKLHALVGAIDHNYTLDGLALFVNAHTARRVDLPFPIESRAIIDRNFALRDLMRATNRAIRYYALVIARESARLYEGYRDTLVEVRNGYFPVTAHHGRSSAHDFDHRKDDQLYEWFNQVDKQVAVAYRNEKLPVVLCGIQDHLAEYKKRADHPGWYVAEVHGNHDHVSPHDLGQKTWEQVREQLATVQAELTAELAEAVSQQRSASGFEQAWQAVQEARVGHLLVEEGYAIAADISESGELKRVDDAKAPGVVDDAVDELCERTLKQGGSVSFLPPGSLDAHQSVAAILRY